jgi:hypothetical protein
MKVFACSSFQFAAEANIGKQLTMAEILSSRHIGQR